MNQQQETRLSVDGEKFVIKGKGAMTGTIPKFATPALAPTMHPLLEGSISDSIHTREALEPLYNTAQKILTGMNSALKECESAFKDYKPDAATQKKVDHIAPHIQKLDKVFAEKWAEVEKGMAYAQNVKAAARELVEPESEIAQLRNEMQAQEARRYAEGMSQKARREFIGQLIDAGDLFSLQALSKIPFRLIDNDPHVIDRAIDSIADDRFPFVGELTNYHEDIARAVKVRMPEINTIASRMLGNHGLKLDMVRASLVRHVANIKGQETSM